MADIWQNPPQSFIRAPLAALAYPAKPADVMEHLLDWSLHHVGASIARKPQVGLTTWADLAGELRKKRPELWKQYHPKTWDECVLLLGAVASCVNYNGNSLQAVVRASQELTGWLLKTGAMLKDGSWEGVNTFTMTMNGMGERNSWWDAMHGVREQGKGGGVNRSDGQLSWNEFRVYAAILSVTGEKQWGRCTREDIAARAAGWVGVKARTKAEPMEIERRRAAGLMLSDKAVRLTLDYLENSGRLAKVRWGIARLSMASV